jgi:hypothetical protein
MEVGFLAQRLVKRGWLGRPRVKLYRKTVLAVCFISLMRTIIGVLPFVFLRDGNIYVTESTRSSLSALSALSFLFATVDWIPYRVYTWQRQPTTLTKWATPASGVVSILANTAFVLVAGATDGLSWMALMALVPAICGAVLMNTGLLYFVYYGPIKLPPVYEPVWKYAGQDQGNDGSASTDTTRSPLARLYQVQMSSNGDTEDERADTQQPASNPIPVSSSLERKRPRRAKYR